MLASECDRHRGLHLFEDLAVVEVVDADGNAVPDSDVGVGVGVGEQILVTSLDNTTQPTIRLAVSDRVAIDPEPCPCGLPMRLLRGVEGRSDDIIHLPSGSGGTVAGPAVRPLRALRQRTAAPRRRARCAPLERETARAQRAGRGRAR